MITLLLLGSGVRAKITLAAGSGSADGAASDITGNTGRKTILVVDYTQYEWWVIRWADNYILCRILTDHQGLPTGSEIYKACGKTVGDLWSATPACPGLSDGSSDTQACTGVYLYFIGSSPAEKAITVNLPSPSVGVSLSGCDPTFPENRCSAIPSLLLTGEEPLPNENIVAIHTFINGVPSSCTGSTCEIPLQPTTMEGITVEFWADSSFGDSSQHFTALVRVIDSGVTTLPSLAGWYVDVLSTQWRGRPTASCAQTWQAFPPLGGPPLWLSTPEIPELLATEEPYAFLAGRLITQGIVDASGCANGGVLANGYADVCGLEKALPEVQKWQNQFDTRIIEVANQSGVPAQLMKNLFAQESQFWPGIFNSAHLGLGHITENGAEVILLWNPSFYEQFCPLVLEQGTCEKGYVFLSAAQQATLRGALALQAKTDCADCPAGIDLTNANFSVDLFAQTLLANCEQVGQEMFNATKKTPGTVSSYEYLWRITVANYHAGPGCLSYALYSTWGHGEPMDWQHVSNYFTPVCQGVVFYVEQIAR